MFFAAHRGPPPTTARWQRSVEAHAKWLDARTRFGRATFDPNDELGWAWWGRGDSFPKVAAEAEPIRVPTSHSARAPTSAPTLQLELELSRRHRRATVWVPHATPEPVFFAHRNGETDLCTDLRFLLRRCPRDLDERGVFGLLQLGAIPPPATLFRSVSRVPNGHRLILDPGGAPRLEAETLPLRSWRSESTRARTSTRILEPLDEVLSGVPSGTVLFFSGGVDSALMAARLDALGRTDVELVFYAFGPDDPEGPIAATIAETLGRRLRRLEYRPTDLEPWLETLSRQYSYPFGDFSSIPTSLMVTASAESGPAAAIDGTGADGLFGIGNKAGMWRRLLRVPPLVRRTVARSFERSHPVLPTWSLGPQLDRAWRIAKRSTAWSPALAAVAPQHTLDGIVFRVPEAVRESSERNLTVRIEGIVDSEALDDRISVVDLLHVCAGQFAAKSLDPLRSREVEPIYPFLEPPMVRAGLTLPWSVKCEAGEEKSPLKRLLAERVPRELVYRKKVGFEPPLLQMLTRAPVNAIVQRVLDPIRNPLVAYCDRGELRKLFDAVGSGHPLTLGALNLVWAHVFATHWWPAVSSLPSEDR